MVKRRVKMADEIAPVRLVDAHAAVFSEASTRGVRAGDPPPPTASQGDADPIWGDMLDGFFGVGRLAPPPATLPAEENKPAPKKPARKRPKAR